MIIKVVCGALVVKDNRFVLVQEAQPYVYGKWNLPAGHLDLNEDLKTGAVREVLEETGLKIKLDGLLGIYEHKNSKGENVVKVVFKASVKSGKLTAARGELLDAKWFSFDEFDALPNSQIRTLDLRNMIRDLEKKQVMPLTLVHSLGFNKK